MEEITKTAKKYTHAKQQLFSVLVHAQRALHTPCSAHHSNGTLIDKRNGQKGMMGTRIIHVLRLWWKGFLAAMVRETISEGGDGLFSKLARFPPGTKERGSNASTTMCGMALDISWKLPSELAHRHEQRLLVHRERNDGGANEQTNVQGRPLDGTETTKRRGFFAGTRWRKYVLMETFEAPCIFPWAFDKTFKRWKMSFSAPLSKVDGSCSGFADDLFIKDELPDHTAESTEDIILNNAASLDETLAEDRYKQNLRKLEIVSSIRRDGGQRRLTSLVPFGKVLGRTRHLGGRYSFNGSNKAEIECRLQAMAANWSALRGFWFAHSSWSHRRLIFLSRIVSASITGIDAYAASPCELNRLDKKFCKYLRALSLGRTCDSAATESHGRSWTNAQLFHKWKVLPARAEIAVRRVKWWQAMTELKHAHLQAMAAIWRQLPGEAQTLTAQDSSPPTANPFAVAFSEDLQLFAGLTGTEDFSELWEEKQFSVVSIFDDEDVRDSFQRTDFKLMRTAAFSNKNALGHCDGEDNTSLSSGGHREIRLRIVRR